MLGAMVVPECFTKLSGTEQILEGGTGLWKSGKETHSLVVFAVCPKETLLQHPSYTSGGATGA
jgi:hypothetical protein